jgi:hypothetical protein
MDSCLGISAFPPYLNAEKESHPALFPIGRFFSDQLSNRIFSTISII